MFEKLVKSDRPKNYRDDSVWSLAAPWHPQTIKNHENIKNPDPQTRAFVISQPY